MPAYAGVVRDDATAEQLNKNPIVDGFLPGQALYWAKYTKADAEFSTEEFPIKEGDSYLTNDYNIARNTDSRYYDNIMPLAYGGFGINATAYGFDLSLNFSYQFGGKMLDSGYQNVMGSGSSVGAWHTDILNAWTPDNMDSDIPALFTVADKDYVTSNSDRFLVSSNYLQLQNITLGYTLPSSLTRKVGIDAVRIYGSAENVALWTARKGLDPRQVLSAGMNFSGSNYTYSPIRAFSGGIRVSF